MATTYDERTKLSWKLPVHNRTVKMPPMVDVARRRVASPATRVAADGSVLFPLDQPLLAVLDGAKGLRAAVREVFGDIPVQRCQWHKRENVVSDLATQDQAKWRRTLEAAYAQLTYRRGVTRWRTSDQKLRWCASALRAMERQFRRVKNHRHLRLLKQALQGNVARTTSAAA